MEDLKYIMEKLEACVLSQMEMPCSSIDTHEMGEVIDMIKDVSQTMYYCTVVEAMEKGEASKKIISQVIE